MHKEFCEVVAYADAAKTQYVTFLVQEIKRTLLDIYTGVSHNDVPGLVGAEVPWGGMFAARRQRRMIRIA